MAHYSVQYRNILPKSLYYSKGCVFHTELGQAVNKEKNVVYVSTDKHNRVWTPLHSFVDEVCMHVLSNHWKVESTCVQQQQYHLISSNSSSIICICLIVIYYRLFISYMQAYSNVTLLSGHDASKRNMHTPATWETTLMCA